MLRSDVVDVLRTVFESLCRYIHLESEVFEESSRRGVLL